MSTTPDRAPAAPTGSYAPAERTIPGRMRQS